MRSQCHTMTGKSLMSYACSSTNVRCHHIAWSLSHGNLIRQAPRCESALFNRTLQRNLDDCAAALAGDDALCAAAQLAVLMQRYRQHAQWIFGCMLAHMFARDDWSWPLVAPERKQQDKTRRCRQVHTTRVRNGSHCDMTTW